jgi:hypothetical protein
MGERQKDVLIIRREWYPEGIPIDSAPGWWYVPAEAIAGRLCKRCNTFREKAEFTSNEWDRMNKASCRKCKSEERKCIKRSEAKSRKVSEKHRLMDERSSRAARHARRTLSLPVEAAAW